MYRCALFLLSALSPVLSAQPRAETMVVNGWMAGMTLRDKVAQLVIVPFYGENPGSRTVLYRGLAQQVQQLRVGGLVILNRVQGGVVRNASPATMSAFLNRMQRLSRVPLIVGGDFERASSMRVTDSTRFPHNMAFAAARDLNASRKLGAITARESRAMGVHWIFAPVADVNSNPDNPIINIRAYSEDPAEVAAHVKAYIDGARSDPRIKVLVTAKHFPGHGDTAVDTHVGLAKVEADRARIESLELVPFRAAIESKVDSVMTAHLWVPAFDEREIPATVSPLIISDLLRKQLGFQGIITTDAMDMHGLSKQMSAGEAAVRAIEAGVDILLIPSNPAEAVRAVVAAVTSGRIPRARIESSLRKLLEAKVRLGLHQSRFVNLENIPDQLAWDEDEALAREVAEKAVTLVRNENRTVPLGNPGSSCWIALSEARNGTHGKRLIETLEKALPKAQRHLVDPLVPQTELDAIAGRLEACESVVIAVYAGHQSNGALSDRYTQFLESVRATGKPLILVALGNPYLLRAFPSVAAYLVTFSTTAPSEEAAVGAILGKFPIQGKLPITIPGLAKYGDGL